MPSICLAPGICLAAKYLSRKEKMENTVIGGSYIRPSLLTKDYSGNTTKLKPGFERPWIVDFPAIVAKVV